MTEKRRSVLRLRTLQIVLRDSIEMDGQIHLTVKLSKILQNDIDRIVLFLEGLDDD